MNNKGFMLMDMMILGMAVIVFVALLPAISDTTNDARGCGYLNCAGYVDTSATSATVCSSTNRTYQSGYDSNELGCTILDLQIPFLILGVLIALIGLLIKGQMSSGMQPEQSYQSYLGGY